MKRTILPAGMVILLTAGLSLAAAKGTKPPAPTLRLSEETEACLACHELYTPGIVADWRASRHSQTTPAQALTRPPLSRMVSSESIPEKLQTLALGCFECHGQNPSAHPDTFEHMGYEIHAVVSPNDCKTCHAREVDEYTPSKMANACVNLDQNPVYQVLVEASIGVKEVKDGQIIAHQSSAATRAQTCFGCHGTRMSVKGMKKIATVLGEIEVPDLTNWPNQGVGRVNPDSSLGACTACHPRHGFSIEVARKPWTCAQCHLEPDVPGWEVWRESKHGNLALSAGDRWNWTEVPWQAGKDFTAPTCAVCHAALIVGPNSEVIAQRSHDFGARLWVRLFGLPYAHAQPKTGDTSIIKNADGLPLPTTFANVPAAGFLIDSAEQDQRRKAMSKVCTACHSTDWANLFFLRLDTTVQETNQMTYAATQLLERAWDKGLADQSNPFDEVIEQEWVEQWLFYSNSIRYAGAMSGPDYASFKNGWWKLSNRLQEMKEKATPQAKKQAKRFRP